MTSLPGTTVLCLEPLRTTLSAGKAPDVVLAVGARFMRDEVEVLFQRPASASLGHPGLLEGQPAGREAAARS